MTVSEDTTDVAGGEPEALASDHAQSMMKKVVKPEGNGSSTLLLLERAPEESQAARVWRQAEAMYRALAERIKAVTYVYSLEAGNPALYVSSQLESFGYSPQRWLRTPDFHLQICYEDDRSMLSDALRRSMLGSESFCCDYRIRCSSGEIRWVREEAHVVPDAAGNPLLLQGVIVDITGDKRVHDELVALRRNLEHQVTQRTQSLVRRIDILESCNAVLCERLDEAHAQNDAWRQVKSRYDFIMRALSEAVVFINPHYQIVDLTEDACRLAGWDRESAVEHQLLDVLQFTDARGRPWEMADHLAELSDEMGRDVYIKYLDDTLVPVRARLAAIGSGGSAREYALTLERLSPDWAPCGE